MKFLAQAYQNADAFSGSELENLEGLLHLMAAHPGFQAYKEASYKLLELSPDSHAADVACGLGFDLPHLKALVPRGSVTGFDLSAKFLASAKARIQAAAGGTDASIHFLQSDIKALDADTGAFDAVRIDRSLQHIPEPEVAIAEMLRIVRPGGIICAAEPDWGSFVIASSTPEIATKVAAVYACALVNPRIGRDLVDLIGTQTELTHHSVHSLLFKSLADLNRMCVLGDITARSVEAGVITSSENARFWQDLEERDRAGRCFANLNIHLVSGRKP